MTKDQACAAMIRIMEENDKEEAHMMADHLLCVVLREQGWETLAGLFDKMEKWYA